MDKSRDHPWTTQDMRKKRREWSLAGDAGLLKHLQEFSDNLVSRAHKTEEALDSLTSQLNETAILIDSVTNTSLALANTQFIESRVQEDDVEIQKEAENSEQESKNEDAATADLIASVSESIKQGLNIMDEKYKKMEFIDSDSEEEEEEEEDNNVVLSILLGPNNPYQDRPLPYVIGSEKWKNSIKIGLESSSSSSESESVDEEETESDEDNNRVVLRDYDMDVTTKTNIADLIPRMSEPDYTKTNDITYTGNDKMDVVSQNNVHSASESITPNESVQKVPSLNDSAPSFAEELAKRLGTVRRAQKPHIADEKSEGSINRFTEDLFTSEGDENVNDKSKKTLSGQTFFNDQVSENSWKERPIKTYKNNIIPASNDVPPPINTVSSKPKSAIDDLFADADSEDSDDIFSSKKIVTAVTKNKHPSGSNSASKEIAQNKYLDIVTPAAASTPEINVNTGNLFSDDEDADLFGSSKNQLPTKKEPVGGRSILGNILTAEIESKIANRLHRTQSSGSSGSNTPSNYENNQESVRNSSRNTIPNDNMHDRISIVVNESTHTSGISVHPPSMTLDGSSISANFQPPMTSTRNSEELYRERVSSDSLLTARTQNQISGASNSNVVNNQSNNEHNEDVSLTQQDDVFEDEDLFGPPPLPKADSKPAKSKVSSLFDDSDSGDELFSTTSSGSRSQKSTDFLTAAPQHPDKVKITQRRGLFDEDINIFGSKDSPDVDIFGITSKPTPKEDSNASKKFSSTDNNGLFGSSIHDAASKSSTEKRQSVASKKISLFDDVEDMDDGDLFAVKPAKNETKTGSRIFNDDDDGDLFSVKKGTDEKPASVKQPGAAGLVAGEVDSDLFSVKATDKKQDKQSVPTGLGISQPDRNTSNKEKERKGSDILSGNGFFSSVIGPRELVFEDDDYDGLFDNKSATAEKKEKKKSTSEMKGDTKVEALVKDTAVSDSPKLLAENREPSQSTDPLKKVEQSSVKDTRQVAFEESHAAGNVEQEVKKSPPKSLDIYATTSSPPSEESGQTRRAVSGKIKNLMGKMNDLKILSPMDTPPMWRKSEEKTDEEDSVADRDSDDGGCISTQGHSSPLSVSEDSTAQKQSLQSTVSGESNVESAISFDEPVQVETLSAASKTRVRIQAKRRPQSRHARKSALRQSGIDFDTVDSAENHLQSETRGEQSSTVAPKENTTSMNVNSAQSITNSERLAPCLPHDIHRTADVNSSLTVDDKSELGSISKESSMSANKNTLLSPSTDEEDLFDVPPDLPEDPQKEDTLFGRAPILSPVDRVLEKAPVVFKPLKDTHIKRADSVETEKDTAVDKSSKISALADHQDNSIAKTVAPVASKKDDERDSNGSKDESKEVIDPLRDSSHDPIKDPSSLFAFVTKTPSPEKGKSLLFAEDNSLFSSGVNKSSEDQVTKKSVLDLFTDDAEGDLFSTSLSKPVKKPLKDTKISLFDDDGQDDEDDSLFGPIVKKSSTKSESGSRNSAQQSRKKASLFDDDDDDANLFSEHSEHSQKSESGSIREQTNKTEVFASLTEPVKTSHITDIFADQSSGEDDIFASKPKPKKIGKSKSLFPGDDGEDDDDNSNIFGKKPSTSELLSKPTDMRGTVKKAITRDLKKTAEKIAEDPLSLLQDD